MPFIIDDEFGKILVRRIRTASQIKIRVAPNGSLRASAPSLAPLFLVKNLIKQSRDDLRTAIKQSKPSYQYENGMKIGKSHTLIIQQSINSKAEVVKHGLQIIVKLPNPNIISAVTDKKIREAITSALRTEAKSYLPKRLSFLANKFGYSFTKTRFSHSGGRWGSCSSNGTIGLNIALMKLPFELIDYVLIHELAHTKQMNHSKQFWTIVQQSDPNYLQHRRLLKKQTPSI